MKNVLLIAILMFLQPNIGAQPESIEVVGQLEIK